MQKKFYFFHRRTEEIVLNICLQYVFMAWLGFIDSRVC